MPWFRLDENVMDHPKFLALSDGAWRLWCEGQSYCQKHLTDGLIVLAALRGFRYFSTSRLKQLTATLVPDKGPCWHVLENGSIQVHDYFDWNDPREAVLKAREESRNRKQKWKDKNASKNASVNASQDARGLSEVGRGSSLVLPSNDPERTGSREVSGAHNPELSERAGRFVELFSKLFSQYRTGAKYHSKPSLDYAEALGLCATWPDSRLETLAVAFLTTDDKFCRNGNGSIAQFRSRASWCDAKLKEAGL
jgi:hypothetical protein